LVPVVTAQPFCMTAHTVHPDNLIMANPEDTHTHTHTHTEPQAWTYTDIHVKHRSIRSHTHTSADISPSLHPSICLCHQSILFSSVIYQTACMCVLSVSLVIASWCWGKR